MKQDIFEHYDKLHDLGNIEGLKMILNRKEALEEIDEDIEFEINYIRELIKISETESLYIDDYQEMRDLYKY